MPLPSDPKRYPEGPAFYSLAAAVVRGEDYAQEFKTNGEVNQFSQRFYGYRKAIEKRLAALDSLRYKAQRQSVLNTKKGSQLTQLIFNDAHHREYQQLEQQLYYLAQVVIKKPDGARGRKILATTREDSTLHNEELNSFLARNAALLPDDTRELYAPQETQSETPQPGAEGTEASG